MISQVKWPELGSGGGSGGGVCWGRMETPPFQRPSSTELLALA